MQNAGNWPAAMTWSEQSLPSGVNIETMTPAAFTIEASFKAVTLSGFHTIVGRDDRYVANTDSALASLYFQVVPGNAVAFKFTDEAGYWHEVISAPAAVTTGRWYNMVGVSDGLTMSLYLDNNLLRQVDLRLSGSTNTALALGSASGGDWESGTWSLGRGLYNGGHVDRWVGYIDEVRISDNALSPSEFLQVPVWAANPTPDKGAKVDATTVALTWSPGASAALHDVYFSTSLDAVTDANSSDPMGPNEVYKAQQSGTKYPPGLSKPMPVTRGQTYYWRIDEVNDSHPDKLWRGEIWSFDVVSNLNYEPNPPDQDTFVRVTTDLSWSKGAKALLGHIIYLSTDFNDVNDAVAGTEGGPAYLDTIDVPATTTIEIPGDLLYNTTYYWRADPVESNPPMLAHKGAVWSFTTGPSGVGTILREIWQGITPTGTAISLLYDWPDFPYNPTITSTLTSFATDPPEDWSQYGGRIHGWVYAPVSGDYTFYLTSDDNGELWLSTDDDPANARLIASESVWRNIYDWALSGEEVSAPITLVGGNKYYISALWKEGTGGDHCAVGWRVPGATSITVIPDRYLMPYMQYWAYDPLPADGASGVSTTPTLSWLPGAHAASHDVYFGTNYADVKDGTGDTLKPSQPLADTDYVPSPALTAGKIYYWKITEVNNAHPDQRWEGPVWAFRVAGGAGGLSGAYYQHTGGASPAGFETFILTRIDPEINFNWGAGSPDPLVDVNDFSCRWTGQVEAKFSEDYIFYTLVDDGERLWVDGQLVIDQWIQGATPEYVSAPIPLVAGQKYDIVMEQYENEGGAGAQLRWSSPSTPKRIIPSMWLWPSTKATNEVPPNGSTGAPLQPTLSWTAGVYAATAAGHKVYFDADEQKVIERLGCQVDGVSTTNPSYPLPWTFGLEETYYWAVDEVNSFHPDQEWRGDTWSFTTINNKVVDDFETYEDAGELDVNWIYLVYTDGFGDLDCTEGSGNGSGAKIALRRPGQGGSSIAMLFEYDNDGMVKTPSACDPAETERARDHYSKAEALVADLTPDYVPHVIREFSTFCVVYC